MAGFVDASPNSISVISALLGGFILFFGIYMHS
jgi:hypothetical protein